MTNERTGKRPRRSQAGRLFALSVVLVVAALASGRREIEARWLPWTPLDLADAPNAWTRLKLDRIDADRSRCRDVLATSGKRFAAVDDRETAPGCGFRNAVRIGRGELGLAAPATLSCRAAVALAGWERHALRPLARRHLGVDVARVEHAGTYACRNVDHRRDGQRSRHATADAIDISGVVLADGRRLRIAHDWTDGGEDGRFLHALHAEGCRWFDGAIGPDYNAAHRDHLHFDRGGFAFCR